jgi:Tol biopolymer transport system component
MNIKLACVSFVYLSCSYPLLGQVPKGRIVFSARLNDGGDTELYAINSDGSGERQITYPNNKGKDLPSGFHNRIVYRQVEDKKSQRASILITGIDGGLSQPIIENKGVCYPRWSHDGKLIAYENYPGNNAQEIWVIDSNGNNNHKLISNARHPCWSYDSETMLFTRDYQVWALDLKKGTEQKLTNPTRDTVALFPALSPDGKLFAYEGQFGNNSGIFIADLKTRKIQKFIPRCGDIFFWTDDPEYIACSCLPEHSKAFQIIMVNVMTGAKIPITHNGRDNYMPCWVNAAK